MKPIRKPLVLLVFPPIYDFALYDLYLKPYGLLRIAGRLLGAGWDVRFINGLDIRSRAVTIGKAETDDSKAFAGKSERESEVWKYADWNGHGTGGWLSNLKRSKRKPDGTGKFHKTEVQKPESIRHIPRKFSRYGVPKPMLEEMIGQERPDIILVSTGMTYWYVGVKEVVETARRVHPGVPIVAGGIYATLMESHCRSVVGPDYTIAGDAWEPLDSLFESLRLPTIGASTGGQSQGDLGTLFPTMRASLGGRSQQEHDLHIPTDAALWHDAGVLRLNEGCPFSCSYCASGLMCRGFRPGDPVEVFGLLKAFYRQGITNIAFYDDALLVNNHDVLLPFLDMVIDSHMEIDFYLPNAVHLQYLDQATARRMYRAGFREIRMGFESSSDSFHRKHDNKLTSRQLPDIVEILREAGFTNEQIKVYILAGLPDQTTEEVEASVVFALRQGASVSLSEYSPVPGTAMWERSLAVSRYPLEEEPLFHNNSLFPMEREGFTRSDLEGLKRLTRSNPM